MEYLNLLFYKFGQYHFGLKGLGSFTQTKKHTETNMVKYVQMFANN